MHDSKEMHSAMALRQPMDRSSTRAAAVQAIASDAWVELDSASKLAALTHTNIEMCMLANPWNTRGIRVEHAWNTRAEVHTGLADKMSPYRIIVL
jgi:hypothetical protein